MTGSEAKRAPPWCPWGFGCGWSASVRWAAVSAHGAAALALISAPLLSARSCRSFCVTGLASAEFQFEVLHAVEGYCARLSDGRLCLLFGDATRCVGVMLGDVDMVSQLHTASSVHLVRPAGATLH